MNYRFVFITITAAILSACGGSSTANVTVSSNTSTPNVNAQTPINAPTPAALDSNLAPAAAPKPVNTPANAPNYKEPGPPPTPVATVSKDKVGTGKVTKPGATPTPGIPSPEEMRRMMSRPVTGDPNSAPSMQGEPMMKSNRRLGGRMSGNTNRP